MAQLFKAFYNISWYRWLQAFAFTIFIFLFAGITTGIVATPIQIVNETSKINHAQTKWDFNTRPYLDDYQGKYLYKYFEEKDDNGEYQNSIGENLLNHDVKVYGLTLDEYFNKLYLTQGNKQNKWNEAKPDFIGDFIRDTILSFDNLYNRQVNLPWPDRDSKNANYQSIVELSDLINPKWNQWGLNNYDQFVQQIFSDLPKNVNLPEIKIDYNFIINYTWANVNKPETFFNIEPINLHKTNNVVTLKRSINTLDEMKDNQVIINPKYAEINNIKLGDKITLNDFINPDGTNSFVKQYEVIGFGTKINNVFLDNQLNNDYEKISNTLYVYLTKSEMDKYINYFYKHNNYAVSPTKVNTIKGDIFTTTRIKTDGNKNFNKLLNAVVEQDVMFSSKQLVVDKYSDLNFVKTIDVYVIEAAIFIMIGLIMLTLATIFINYCLKKELDQVASPIGVLKANGYSSEELIFPFWTRVLLMMFIGFGLGFLASLPIQGLVNNIMIVNCLVTINKYLLSWWFVVTIVVIIPGILSGVSFISLNRYLKKKPLELTNFDSVKSAKVHRFNILSANMSYKISSNKVVIRDSLKTILVSILLILANLVIILEINARTFTNNIINSWGNVYGKNVNSSISDGYQFKWSQLDDDKYTFTDRERYNMNYINYDSNEELENIILGSNDERYSNMTPSMTMTSLLESYNNASNGRSKEVILMRILNSNINNVSVRLSLLEDFIHQLDYDYHNSNAELNQIPGLDKLVSFGEEKVIPYFDVLNEMAQKENKDPWITLNNAFVQNDVDFPVLNLKVNPAKRGYRASNDWKIYLLEDYSYDMFNFSGKKSKNMELMNNFASEYNALPVIISRHMAVLNNLKVGSTLKISLPEADYDTYLKLKIVGINNNDNYTNNIYADHQVFTTNYIHNKRPDVTYYNEIFTKRDFITLKDAKDFLSAKVSTPYYNFFYPTYKDEVVKVNDFMTDFRQVSPFVNLANVNTPNFNNISFNEGLAKSKVKEFYILIDMLIGMTIIVVLILYLVFVLVNINERRNLISTFKAMGYTNRKINMGLIGKYFTSEAITVFISLGISYLIWWGATSILLMESNMVVTNPFSWWALGIVFVAMMTILAIGAISSNKLIEKIDVKPQEEN
ncbi:ABC transporter permease [Mesoplasma lactucae]|uniref:ABC3 transporter permease C-terminal domain-containing protein n=1 Tax=Mesoplasma lactucae ATCC 49193 TaxID=81460 RepID=A0A291ISH8_9MOLU|nr:ABC transporter permease [Mesoplasma lactucae]ATG97688.1 hypothetical protein CP520_03030 [Mesoplasma lactucae ATCC 49193]ATZ19847.1 hypothetical protein MLACT_v1c00220 [Mesoplasma lactucae ATCC 49193]MCL8216710.1 hypothetical protein [Mesoplasma lactucae ATCC 49193]